MHRMRHQTARALEAALLLLPVAALFLFGFRMDAHLDQALPGLSLGSRADIETAVLFYLPEVAMEPAFDDIEHILQYPHPLIGPRRSTWDDRLSRQLASVQQAQGLPTLDAQPSVIPLNELTLSSLDQFGKAIDVALIGGCGPRATTVNVIRELFTQAYGDQTARESESM